MSSRSAWCRCCKLSSSSLCWVRSSSSFRTWEMARGTAWRVGRRVLWAPWGSLSVLSDTLPLQPAPSQLPRCPSPGPPSLPAGPDSAEAQPGAQQCHFETASEQPAAASGILCPVVGSAPGSLGAGTVRGGGDGPGWVGDRAAAELSYLWPSARWTSSALHLIWGLDRDKDMTPRGQG